MYVAGDRMCKTRIRVIISPSDFRFFALLNDFFNIHSEITFILKLKRVYYDFQHYTPMHYYYFFLNNLSPSLIAVDPHMFDRLPRPTIYRLSFFLCFSEFFRCFIGFFFFLSCNIQYRRVPGTSTNVGFSGVCVLLFFFFPFPPRSSSRRSNY